MVTRRDLFLRHRLDRGDRRVPAMGENPSYGDERAREHHKAALTPIEPADEGHHDSDFGFPH